VWLRGRGGGNGREMAVRQLSNSNSAYIVELIQTTSSN
jgi:hypothetical protein